MTTTPEPVSPTPDTEALRQQVAAVLEERIGDNSDLYETVDDVMPLFAEREAGLRADLDQARHDAGEAVVRQNVLRAERDEAQRQEVAWKVSAQESDNGLTLYAREVRWLKECLLARRNALAHLLGQPAAKEDTGWFDLCAQIEERLTAAGARPIPDDAAERLTYALVRMSPGLFRDTPVAPANALLSALWKHVWRDLADHERAEWQAYGRTVLAGLGATPTTGPTPAAADVQWGVQRADGVLDQLDDEADARGHLNWFDPGAAHVVSRTVVYGPWTPTPAVPQAPAEPTETPDAPCGATEGGMGVDCHLPAGHPGWHSASHTPRTDGTESIGYPFHIQWPRFGWDRCASERAVEPHSIPTLAELRAARREQTPAAREDTAPPDVVVHDITLKTRDGYTSATCTPCGIVAGDYDPDWVQDRVDAHLADTFRPSGPLAPAQAANPTPEEKQ
jgi:hypothetical protein